MHKLLSKRRWRSLSVSFPSFPSLSEDIVVQKRVCSFVILLKLGAEGGNLRKISESEWWKMRRYYRWVEEVENFGFKKWTCGKMRRGFGKGLGFNLCVAPSLGLNLVTLDFGWSENRSDRWQVGWKQSEEGSWENADKRKCGRENADGAENVDMVIGIVDCKSEWKLNKETDMDFSRLQNWRINYSLCGFLYGT